MGVSRGREGNERVFGQVERLCKFTYISIFIVTKLLVITPMFLSLLPLKIAPGFIFQIKLNTDDTI